MKLKVIDTLEEEVEGVRRRVDAEWLGERGAKEEEEEIERVGEAGGLGAGRTGGAGTVEDDDEIGGEGGGGVVEIEGGAGGAKPGNGMAGPFGLNGLGACKVNH